MGFTTEVLAQDLIQLNKAWSFITVNETSTVGDVISILKDHKISSAPVVNKQGKSIGLVDILDLLTFACGKLSFKETPTFAISKIAIEEFLKKAVKDLPNVSGRAPYKELPIHATLQDVLQLLAQKNVHRVLIRNEAEDFVGLITQSAMVRYLQQKKDNLSDFMNQRVKDLWPIGQKQTETIDFNCFVIDALARLEEKQISGIAVVNTKGQIIGNISASDLKRMDVKRPLQMCFDVYQSIRVFMNLSDEKDKPSNRKLPTFEPIIVKPDDTLSQVVDIVVSKEVHRVYVVDEDQKPVGEISLCDIMQKMLGTASQ